MVSGAGAIGARRADRRLGALLVVAAICARLWAIALPPAFSEDVFRYVYEGRIALEYGPLFAFAHPPADGPALGVPAALLDAGWLRINHASIPTLYPPLAQAVFALGAWLGALAGGQHVVALKALLVLAELAGALAIGRISRPAGLLMLLCPLSITEIAREGHGDALTLLGLALGLAGLGRAGTGPDARRAALGFALAALGKLIGAVPFLAALRADPRRALWPAALVLALAALPYAFGSTAGLEAYGTAWRSGDGAFSLILAAVERALGGDWARVGDTTVTAHGLARIATAVAFAACAAVVLVSRRVDATARAGLLILLVLLWSPTVHPWYVLWIVPFSALGTRWSAPATALWLLAPLLHHPGWLALDTGQWTDLPGLRAAVHLPAWALLVHKSRVV